VHVLNAVVAARQQFWEVFDDQLFSRPGSRAVHRYVAFPPQNYPIHKIRHFLGWLGYGRTSIWMLRQTEVTAPVNADHRLLALLAFRIDLPRLPAFYGAFLVPSRGPLVRSATAQVHRVLCARSLHSSEFLLEKVH